MIKYKKSIFIFRRDYRLQDNIGLFFALKESKKVIPIFIFTPIQITNNEYKSNNAIQFMVESLIELDNELKHTANSRIWYFFGEPFDVINEIIKNIDIDAIYCNRDYTPYSKERDQKIQKVCEHNKIIFNQCEDSLLYPVGSIKNSSGEIYSKFTPYYNFAKKKKVPLPIKNNLINYHSHLLKIKNEVTCNFEKLYKVNDLIAVHGGRSNCLTILNDLLDFKQYNKLRDYLSISTTKLSAYIKFGVVSIREVYHKIKIVLGNKNELIKQLYWREFYYNIMDNNPHILTSLINGCFKTSFNNVPWITYKTATKNDKILWNKWCEGTTGFPIIDASMRELNTTGFMHNRGRMIVATFLTKNMFWHFKEGEKYFAQHLVDYDPANNNGGWQWCASSGADSMPYFRIFNPWLQSEKYDKECEYIKKWVPELEDISPEHIHKWYIYYKNYNIYHVPMVDASVTAKNAIKKLKKYT